MKGRIGEACEYLLYHKAIYFAVLWPGNLNSHHKVDKEAGSNIDAVVGKIRSRYHGQLEKNKEIFREVSEQLKTS